MYFTHHFAHQESLSRTRSWLTRLGIKPHQIQTHAGGVPRIVVDVESHWLPEIRGLINAVERSDPQGFPSFWDMARRPHGVPGGDESVSVSELPQSRSAIIGWHPPDPGMAADPDLGAIREAMSR